MCYRSVLEVDSSMRFPTPAAQPDAILRAGIHAQRPSLPLERHTGPSLHALAKSLSSLEDRDLHGRQDDADRIPGVLGVQLARAQESVAVPEVDRRDGAVCASQTESRLRACLHKPLPAEAQSSLFP